jgi:hypothetical protein
VNVFCVRSARSPSGISQFALEKEQDREKILMGQGQIRLLRETRKGRPDTGQLTQRSSDVEEQPQSTTFSQRFINHIKALLRKTILSSAVSAVI